MKGAGRDIEEPAQEEQVIGAVKQMEAGRKAEELARELGVSEATLYAWQSKYGGLEVNEARRLGGCLAA